MLEARVFGTLGLAFVGRRPMQATQSGREKRIVERLNFGAKTARRASLEAFEFTVIGPGEVEVRNLSWGHLADDHTHTVRVEDRGEGPIPVACECPGFEHHYGPNGKADKHMVALATDDGPTVLEAAVNYCEASTPSSVRSAESRDAVIRTDGGSVMEPIREGDEACPNGDERCDGPDGADLPCWPCYRTGEGV